MLRQQPFRYRGAALIGFIGGALLFVFAQLALRTEPHDQLQWLLAATVAGSVIACAFVFLWNRAVQRAHERHDQQRGICMARQEHTG